MRKVRLATILGTLQSVHTHFPWLSDAWRRNGEEERLLGVSLSGIMDCALTNRVTPQLLGLLTRLREECVRVNRQWAARLGINVSAAITCVKPGMLCVLCLRD